MEQTTLASVPSYDPVVRAAMAVVAIHKLRLTFRGLLLGRTRYRCRKCRVKTDKHGCWLRRAARATIVMSKHAPLRAQVAADDYLFRPSEQLDIVNVKPGGSWIPAQRASHPVERAAVPA